jgi:hypothetical protein
MLKLQNRVAKAQAEHMGDTITAAATEAAGSRPNKSEVKTSEVQGEGRSHVIIEQSNFNDILNTV